MTDSCSSQQDRPAQQQDRQPGREHEMQPRPVIIRDDYRGSGRLAGRGCICLLYTSPSPRDS